jgi:hypothetical protein
MKSPCERARQIMGEVYQPSPQTTPPLKPAMEPAQPRTVHDVMMSMMSLIEECLICGMQFYQSTPFTKTRHLLTHKGSAMTCFRCDMRVKTEKQLRDHFATKHDMLYECRSCKKTVRGNDVEAHINDDSCPGVTQVRVQDKLPLSEDTPRTVSVTGHTNQSIISNMLGQQVVAANPLPSVFASSTQASSVAPSTSMAPTNTAPPGGAASPAAFSDTDGWSADGNENAVNDIIKNMDKESKSGGATDANLRSLLHDSLISPDLLTARKKLQNVLNEKTVDIIGSVVPVKQEKEDDDEDLIIESYIPAKHRQGGRTTSPPDTPSIPGAASSSMEAPATPGGSGIPPAASESPAFQLSICNVRSLSPGARVEIDNAEVEQEEESQEVINCQICHAAFTQRDKMLEHIKVNHEDSGIENSGSLNKESVVICHVCGTPFAEVAECNRHLKTVHGMNPREGGPQTVEMSDSMRKFLATYAKKVEMYECNLCVMSAD